MRHEEGWKRQCVLLLNWWAQWPKKDDRKRVISLSRPPCHVLGLLECTVPESNHIVIIFFCLLWQDNGQLEGGQFQYPLPVLLALIEALSSTSSLVTSQKRLGTSELEQMKNVIFVHVDRNCLWTWSPGYLGFGLGARSKVMGCSSGVCIRPPLQTPLRSSSVPHPADGPNQTIQSTLQEGRLSLHLFIIREEGPLYSSPLRVTTNRHGSSYFYGKKTRWQKKMGQLQQHKTLQG